MKIYHDADADVSILNGKTIAIIGYGAQGRAQARMMHASELTVVVGVRENGKSWNQVREDGLTALPIAKAAALGDIVHMLIPDEMQKAVYEADIAPHLKPGNLLSFSHGFNIVFGRIIPATDIGVIMVAPKAPGTEEYKCYQQGLGVPALISIHQDTPEGNAKAIALAMAKAMFFTKAGVLECTFAQETHEDLFGEQAVLCGGVTELMKAGFEVLIEAGYPHELAYFECVHEMKLIIDLVQSGGFEKMWSVVSNTAEYGGHTRGKRIVTPAVKEEMRKILKEVEDGSFAKEWMNEADNNKLSNLLAMRKAEAQHPAEIVGQKIRGMFEK